MIGVYINDFEKFRKQPEKIQKAPWTFTAAIIRAAGHKRELSQPA